MAVFAARAIMEAHDDIKSFHPFFEKRTRTHGDLSRRNTITLATKTPSTESAAAPTENDELVRSAGGKAGKPSPSKAAITSNKPKELSSKTTERSAELFEVDPNLGRRKRRKSESPEDGNYGHSALGASEGTIHIAVGHDSRPGTAVASADTANDHDAEGCGPKRSSNSSSPTKLVRSSTLPGDVEQANIQTPFGPVADTVAVAVADAVSSVALNGLPNETANVISAPSILTTPGLGGTKPLKTLRLNTKTGTIGSPPPKKTSKSNNATEARKKHRKTSTQSQSIIFTIKYGHDRNTRSITGQNIDDILSGVKSFPFLPKPPPKSQKPVPQLGPSKSTHPFFLGTAAAKMLIPDHVGQTNAKVAKEGKPIRPRPSLTLGEAKNHSPAESQNQAFRHGAFQQFGNATKFMKFPRAVEACWPPKEMAHIRGLAENTSQSHKSAQVSAISTQRKSKYTATETLAKDNMLKIVAKKLDINNILRGLKSANTDKFAEPGRSLRLPVKHFENGFQIQRKVRRELSVKLPLSTTLDHPSDSEDELRGDGKQNAQINPTLLKIFNSLPSALTAFDRSQYETQSWIHKYSPCTAAEVLQCGKEAFILKEWLRSLTIISVGPGTTDSAHSRATSVASRRSGVSNTDRPGKKKRKGNKLEGFVISSEEEDNEMDEISDPEEDNEESHRLTKRTVIRSGDTISKSSKDSKKLKNAVVISGPSGCGKTAMVYGVAKELGFEIFEINSSSRRSGKEILERVGDMTRNHLVHRSGHSGVSDPQNEDIQRVTDTLSADLKSGRQETMNSFFKPKKSTDPTMKNTNMKVFQKDASGQTTKSSKAPPKQQKQSLILLEEVDVLFEEDKQFWTTVMNLIAQSKRPIIMTCNDETLLPLHVLELHAIIRLCPPPSNVAIDYMLLVAAAEGHLIKRKAVKALYEARRFDLRAALTELDYWCQLGVGDRKGGLDWFFPRWPPGCDVDGDGHKIRIVSEGTYKIGMGWLGRDYIFERLNDPDVKEEMLREAWDGWGIDIGDWHGAFETSSPLEDTAEASRLSLSSYEAFAESMSVADVCAYNSLATGNQVLLDTSGPPLTAKSRDDFIVGYELLQADTAVSYDALNKELAIWIKAHARQLVQSYSHARFGAPSEAQLSAKIAASGSRRDDSICRQDFSIAFDPIAEPEKNTVQSPSSLEPSVFDRTTTAIAVDVAPYVRSIVAYDVKLQQERARLSNLLSEGGRKGKRLRTTRSALSALEGGARETTRPEKYFRVPLNPHLVYRTGLQSWQDAVYAEMSEADARETPPALDGFEVSSPGMTDSS